MRLFNYNCQLLGDKIQIHTVGCEASMSDAYNFACTLPQDEEAIVFGTCSFVEDRSQESLIITDILRTAYPNHKMYIIGCDINNQKDKYKFFDNIYTNEEVAKIISNRKILDDIRVNSLQAECMEDPIINIKIQDGCNHRCTYCVINQLRNKPYSVPYAEIVNLIKEQIKARPNYERIVLSGTEVTTYYDMETGYKLCDLVEHLVLDLPEIKRLTMTAIDPAPPMVNSLMKVMNKYNDKIIPYLLLGVQSGSDTILKSMNRRHNVKRIKELHSLAKEYGITLGWDIIVGFPGETEELFQETCDLMKQLQPFTQNIFMYSNRKGTPASEMPNQVEHKELVRRDRVLHELMFNYAKDNPKFKPFEEYADEAVKYEQANVNRRRALEMMFLEEAEEYWFGILDPVQIADVVRFRPENKLLHCSYIMDKSIECETVINMLKVLLRGFPLIVHAPHSFAEQYNVKDFENLFHCIVVLED